jgi:hypothetical protein
VLQHRALQRAQRVAHHLLQHLQATHRPPTITGVSTLEEDQGRIMDTC